LTGDFKIDTSTLLCLSQVPGIGPQRIRNLIARFENPTAIFKASCRELVEVAGIDKKLAVHIKEYQKNDFAQRQLEKARQLGVKIITFWDNEYPEMLKNIPSAPVFLFVRGTLTSDEQACIAIVGTRTPSSYGKLQAEKFARELCARGITIISGLARGVDTIAHRAVVNIGGRTIAVLGSGIDTIYPEENRALAEQICGKGAVISEFPMMTKPDAINFPRRNRIISGLSLGTLVVEAGRKSGALITADFAVEQGRDVYAIPGAITNPKSFGCHDLIQQGAKLVQTADDIFEEIGMEKITPLQRQTITESLTNQEQTVLAFLSPEMQHIDLIASQVQLPISHVLSVLLALELKNLVRQFPGKNFVRL
jgi:DNA processing protein